MATIANNERIFWLDITQETIYELAEEMDIPREKVTPEMMQEVKNMVRYEFRHWDTWLKELIQQLVDKS